MKLLAVVLAGTVLLLLCGAVATLVIARVIDALSAGRPPH